MCCLSDRWQAITSAPRPTSLPRIWCLLGLPLPSRLHLGFPPAGGCRFCVFVTFEDGGEAARGLMTVGYGVLTNAYTGQYSDCASVCLRFVCHIQVVTHKVVSSSPIHVFVLLAQKPDV